MAYLDRKHSISRPALVAVIAIEALAIMAVVRGLQVRFERREPPPRIAGEQIRLAPLPKPEASPKPRPVTREAIRPDMLAVSRGDLGHVSSTMPFDPGPIALPSPLPLPLPEVTPEPPRVAPRAARPLGRPGSWVSANDYPARDLREGNQGLVRFRLAVGADGGVTDCVIVGPSGFPGLDSATCDNLRRRARFEPASDGTGAKVAGSYAGTIRWLIPER